MKYSIRMRSAEGGPHEKGGNHISGAERIVDECELGTLAEEMINRALHHSKGKPDFINITIEEVKEEDITHIEVPTIITHEVNTVVDGHAIGKKLLELFGITTVAVDKGFFELSQLKVAMHGAIVLSSIDGTRLDDLGNRGLRVSHMDLLDSEKSAKKFEENGLGNVHVREAVVLAGKVLSGPGVVGELCWSDDPDYVVGYVSGNNKYHRITKMKEINSPRGGRVFFVHPSTNVNELKEYLEQANVLVHC